ncbi:MAG: hypothetical protein DME04_23340 [Candidatus Rokuibacteriota bacterium]|nr:MAG: hypothetical protein DME04_23340 [Candidatus Rokubacteria bacterium]
MQTSAGGEIIGTSTAGAIDNVNKENDDMKLVSTFAIALATALIATAASAEWTPRDDIQAPRGQDVQAPRDRTDEIQAPRGDHQDEIQAPRGPAQSTRG